MGRDSAGRFTKGGGIGVTVKFDTRSLGRSIETLPDRIDGQVHAVIVYQSIKAQSHMKVNAKWTDRTGNARNGLGVSVDWVPRTTHAIHLFHRMWYGIFLETRWAGKYAIIRPTIEIYGPDTMRLLNKLFRKLGTGGGMP